MGAKRFSGERLKIGLCQLPVRPGRAGNLERAARAIRAAAGRGAGLVVLPEMFDCPYDTALFAEYAEPVPGGPACRMLSELARELGIFIVGGSIPERGGKYLYNTSPVFDPRGRLIARHRKMHLFDVSLKSVSMRESAVLSAGDVPTLFRTPFGPVGLLICYDARFPEAFRFLADKGAVAICAPAAFSVETGQAHWHALMRMRAVDNQLFVLACSPARNRTGYRAFGHSLAADPWGGLLCEAGTGEEVVTAVLERKRLEEVRARLPILKHRRADLYHVAFKG